MSDYEFKFTMDMFPNREFCVKAPSLISGMMQVMKENGVSLQSNVLREIALQVIEDIKYKWLNKP